jgi:hypothetical protein
MWKSHHDVSCDEEENVSDNSGMQHGICKKSGAE